MAQKFKTEDIIKMHEEGKTPAEIAYRLNCSTGTVYARIKEYRLEQEASEDMQSKGDYVEITGDEKWQKPMFHTASLALAAAIVLHSYPVIKIEVNETNRYTFFFDEHLDIESIRKNFWDRRLKLDVRTYYDTVNDLRQQARQAQNSDYNNHREYWGKGQ